MWHVLGVCNRRVLGNFFNLLSHFTRTLFHNTPLSFFLSVELSLLGDDFSPSFKSRVLQNTALWSLGSGGACTQWGVCSLVLMMRLGYSESSKLSNLFLVWEVGTLWVDSRPPSWVFTNWPPGWTRNISYLPPSAAWMIFEGIQSARNALLDVCNPLWSVYLHFLLSWEIGLQFRNLDFKNSLFFSSRLQILQCGFLHPCLTLRYGSEDSSSRLLELASWVTRAGHT